MQQELSDMYQLVEATHTTFDSLVEDLSAEEWVTKPRPDFNCVAAVLHHVDIVEKRFLSILDGQTPESSSYDPFTAESWDTEKIRQSFHANLQYAEQVLTRLDPATLTQQAAELRIGKLNRRQLLAYLIAHTTHHRGQIPLIKKLLRN